MKFLSKIDELYQVRANEEPDESDAFLSSSGPLGSKTSVSVDKKFLGEFNSDEYAENVLVDWMIKHKFYPNVWYVSDHGNVHPYELCDESKEKLGWTK